MIKQIIILFLLLFYNVGVVECQTYFSKNYPIINHSGGGGLNVIENNDGYIAVTPPISTLSGKRNIVIIQTDFDGNVLFEKNYGDTTYSYNIGFQGSFQKVSTGGYIMFGNKEDTNRSYDLLYRFNDSGDVLWTKQLGDSTAQYGYIGYNVKETPDGGFICIGVDGNSNNPVWMVKINSLGNKQWEQHYGGPNWDVPVDVAICNDGGYIYTGTSRNSGSMPINDQIRIMKVDSLGNVVFNKFFGEELDYDSGYGIMQTQDGGYAISGTYKTSAIVYPFLLKLDSNGDSLWMNKINPLTIGSSNSNTLRSILEIEDGSIVAAGNNWFYGDASTYHHNGLVVKLTATGDLVWQREHHIAETNTESSYIYDIRRTSDNGFICSGYSSQPQEMWLLKLDSLGCADTACTLAVGVEAQVDLGIGFSVYPNPAHSFITVELQQPISSVNFKLIDITGKQVLTQQLNSSYTQINVQGLPKGIYFYRLIGEKEQYSGKLVIQ